MAGKTGSQPVLSIEQQAEADLIYERIRGALIGRRVGWQS